MACIDIIDSYGNGAAQGGAEGTSEELKDSGESGTSVNLGATAVQGVLFDI